MRKRRKKKKKKKQKKKKTINIKRVVEEWEIWDEEKEATRLEAEIKKLVPEKFHKWIQVFGKKQSEWMPIQKIWNHVIETKENFVSKKGKIYSLSREEKEEVREFIREQLRKEYI